MEPGVHGANDEGGDGGGGGQVVRKQAKRLASCLDVLKHGT